MNEPDRANRRLPISFRERVGEVGIAGFAAAAAHLECSTATFSRSRCYNHST
jgi:hypothetical protein